MSSLSTKTINANKSVGAFKKESLKTLVQVIAASGKIPRVNRVCVSPTTVPRREALGLLASVLGGAVVMTERKADALEVPFQESIAGRAAVAQSEASMLAYGMEGIKKGGLSAKRKRQLLDKLKEEALANAQK